MTTSRLPLDELPPNEAVAVADGRAVVVRVGDDVQAFVNRCLHQDLPLAGAHVADGVLICPHHFWRYELPDGRLCSGADSTACLTAVDVEIDGGDVVVDLPWPPPPEPGSLREHLLARAETWNRDDPPEPHHPGARDD